MTDISDHAQMVRRMLAAGRELSEEQRSALLRLHARFEQLWAKREAVEGPRARQQRERASASSRSKR